MNSAIFFHPAAERNSQRENRIAQAKAVCSNCPVIAACRTWALHTMEPHWDGLSEDERSTLLALPSLRWGGDRRATTN